MENEVNCKYCEELEKKVMLELAKRDRDKSRKDALNKLGMGIVLLIGGIIAAYMNRNGE